VRPDSSRLRKLLAEITSFGVIGGLNFLVDLGIFNLLIWIGSLKATVVSTVVAATVSYFLNRHWTYRNRPRSALRREYALFFLFNLVGLGIQLGTLGLARYGLHLDARFELNAAKVLGIGLGTVFRFFAYRTWVFREPVVATAGVPAQPAAPSTEELAPTTGPAGQ
jgi:putative flippase GtrA